MDLGSEQSSRFDFDSMNLLQLIPPPVQVEETHAEVEEAKGVVAGAAAVVEEEEEEGTAILMSPPPIADPHPDVADAMLAETLNQL